MSVAGSPIEAVLTLNATSFHNGLNDATKSVKSFVAQVGETTGKVNAFVTIIDELKRGIGTASTSLANFTSLAKETDSFNKFANGIKSLATATQMLEGDTATASVGIARVTRVIESMQGVFGSAEVKITGVASALRELSNYENNVASSSKNADSSFKQMQQDLLNMANSSQGLRRVQEQTQLMNREFQKSRNELMQFARYGVQAFNQIDARPNTLKTQMASMNAEFERAKSELMEFARYGKSQFGTITAGVQQYAEALEIALPTQRQLITNNVELANAERQKSSADNQLVSSSNQVTSAEEKQSTATDKGTQSMKKQESASKSLKNSLGMLKNAVTLVGSMIAYNFAHNLAMATTETINAKSEMNGYFQMLGYSTKQTQDFNNALQETVEKFPRLNKYALGETISSIGVEFELSTKEMKKAMPVVSMITSEYLRAGRNVNEASLAVKDILQGEFQRLSRETGVKGEQLKEAGWSGDKTDVMGLLEALDKVGKERNWDTFVQKANSLNDAVLITQNRFSEWSADMVEKVQPAILGVFNDLMVVGSDFGKAFSKIMDWLLDDGIAQSIVKWGGLATAIGVVSTAIIHARTGMGLMQISQMGLLKSIGVTVLGLEAETVAQYGLGTSITMAITGLEAEELANISNTKAIFSSILGLDLATVKQYGFWTALLSSTTGIEAETIAMEGLNAEMLLAIGSFTAMASVIALATGVLISQAIQISQTTEKYKKFVDMVEKGEDIISEAKGNMDDLTNKKEKLTEKLATLEKGTYEYNLVANQLKTTTDELSVATSNYSDAVNSVAWAKHKQELYDEEKASAQADAQKEINQALLDYGFNVEEASQLSSQYWNDAINGWDQHYETLQKVNRQYEKNAVSVKSALNKLNETELDDKEVTVLIRRKISSGNAIADAKEEVDNATSLTVYIDKWLWLQVRQIQNALVDFDINMATEGLSGAIAGLVWGLVHFLGDHFIGQFTQQLARDWGWEGVGSEFGVYLKTHFDEFINDVFDSFLGGLTLNVPILGTFISILDDLSDENLGATVKGEQIGKWISDGLNSAIDQIPLLGDVKRLLEYFAGTDEDANQKGQSVGNNLTTGIQTGIAPLDGILNSLNTTFGNHTSSVSANASTMASNVNSSYSSMRGKQKSSLDSMVSYDSDAWDVMKTNNHTSLLSMKDSTSQSTKSMASAFRTLKDNITKSSNQIKTNSSNDFISLGGVISQFYKNIQNPANWSAINVSNGVGSRLSGAGVPSRSASARRPIAGRRAVRTIGGKHGAGVNPYTQSSSKTMGIQDLVKMIGVNEDVPINQFLALFGGGFGGWDYSSTHRNYIRNKAYDWDTGRASINGIGQVGHGYKVNRWKNGKASFTFDDFQSTAQDIFSVIPYKFYYDSEWKGSWVNALMSGAVNCSDGADALINLARTFGFDGYKQHTTLANGVGHFFAVINGKKMDTTAFQQHGSWSPLGGAGIPVRTSHSNRSNQVSNQPTEVNVTINGDVYGVDDLDAKISDGVDKGLQKHFNKAYTGVI